MKIIKEGDLKKLRNVLIFECDTCGCVFEADDTEYSEPYDGCSWYEMECPACSAPVEHRKKNGGEK